MRYVCCRLLSKFWINVTKQLRESRWKTHKNIFISNHKSHSVGFFGKFMSSVYQKEILRKLLISTDLLLLVKSSWGGIDNYSFTRSAS